MSSFRKLAVAASIGACSFVSLAACSDEPAPAPIAAAGSSGSQPIVVDDPIAGSPAADSRGAGASAAGANAAGAGSGGASGGSGGSGGSTAGAAAGSGGGSGGNGGALAGGAGGSGGQAGGAGAAGASEDDFFSGLFPSTSSCAGYLCLEATDCTSLYPEASSCKFTRCEDFMCK